MTYDPHESGGQGMTSGTILDTIHNWQMGRAPREAVVGLLTSLGSEQGDLIQETVQALVQWVGDAPKASSVSGPTAPQQADSEAWRSELMSSRAKAWAFPHSAGLLVSPSVLILTDGQQGVILHADHTRALPTSTAGSLMLLCQTIVMAQNAVDAKELSQLQQQRIESTSTSLSEIEIIR